MSRNLITVYNERFLSIQRTFSHRMHVWEQFKCTRRTLSCHLCHWPKSAVNCNTNPARATVVAQSTTYPPEKKVLFYYVIITINQKEEWDDYSVIINIHSYMKKHMWICSQNSSWWSPTGRDTNVRKNYCSSYTSHKNKEENNVTEDAPTHSSTYKYQPVLCYDNCFTYFYKRKNYLYRSWSYETPMKSNNYKEVKAPAERRKGKNMTYNGVNEWSIDRP